MGLKKKLKKATKSVSHGISAIGNKGVEGLTKAALKPFDWTAQSINTMVSTALPIAGNIVGNLTSSVQQVQQFAGEYGGDITNLAGLAAGVMSGNPMALLGGLGGQSPSFDGGYVAASGSGNNNTILYVGLGAVFLMVLMMSKK